MKKICLGIAVFCFAYVICPDLFPIFLDDVIVGGLGLPALALGTLLPAKKEGA